MMKDEAPFLLEWVAFHRLVGFERICVYTNDCTDGTEQMLDRLAEMGEVLRFDNVIPPGKKPQPNALTLAEKNHAVTETEWLLVMDADEFVNVKCGAGRVSDLLEACPVGVDAVALTWRMMGSNGHEDWNPGLVIESYPKGAPDDFNWGWGVKTLFRPFEGMKLGIHRPKIKKAGQNPDALERLADQVWVNGSGEALTRRFKRGAWRSSHLTVGYSLAEMNHFAVKSLESFLLRDVRGNVNNKVGKYGPGYFAFFDRNEVAVPEVARWAPAVRAKLADYLADPVLARLQAEGLAEHRARLDRLRAGGAFETRRDALRKAASVPYDALTDHVYLQPMPDVIRARAEALRRRGLSERDVAARLKPMFIAYQDQINAEDARELETLHPARLVRLPKR